MIRNNFFIKYISLFILVVGLIVTLNLQAYAASSSSSSNAKVDNDKDTPPQTRMTDNTGEITRETYQYTTKIGSIKIGPEITSIEEGAFNNQLYLASIEVDEANTKYASMDGVLYDKELTTLICFPQGLHAANIPNTVVKIAPGAMYGKSSGLKKQIKALVTQNNGGTYPGFDKYVNDPNDPYIIGGTYKGNSSSSSSSSSRK